DHAAVRPRRRLAAPRGRYPPARPPPCRRLLVYARVSTPRPAGQSPAGPHSPLASLGRALRARRILGRAPDGAPLGLAAAPSRDARAAQRAAGARLRRRRPPDRHAATRGRPRPRARARQPRVRRARPATPPRGRAPRCRLPGAVARGTTAPRAIDV